MVLNEFYTNPDVYDLAMLGIEESTGKQSVMISTKLLMRAAMV